VSDNRSQLKGTVFEEPVRELIRSWGSFFNTHKSDEYFEFTEKVKLSWRLRVKRWNICIWISTAGVIVDVSSNVGKEFVERVQIDRLAVNSEDRRKR